MSIFVLNRPQPESFDSSSSSSEDNVISEVEEDIGEQSSSLAPYQDEPAAPDDGVEEEHGEDAFRGLCWRRV